MKCRILERGQVSEDGWGKLNPPFNVPEKKVYIKNLITILLINYKDIAFDKEEVKEIYLFKTSSYRKSNKINWANIKLKKKIWKFNRLWWF